MKKFLFVLAFIGTVLFASTAFAKTVNIVDIEHLIGRPLELVVWPDGAYRGYLRSSKEHHFFVAAGSPLEVKIRGNKDGIEITKVEMMGSDANKGSIIGNSYDNQPSNFADIKIHGDYAAEIAITPSQSGYAPYKMLITCTGNNSGVFTASFGAWLHTDPATLPSEDDLVSSGSGCNAGFGVGAMLAVLALGALRKKGA